MIEKLKKLNKTQILLTVYTIINIIYLPVAMIKAKYYSKTFYPGYEQISKTMIILLIINVLLILFLLFVKKMKPRKVDWLLVLMIVFAGISTYFAYDSKIALYGAKYRYEGLFQIAYYISMLFLTSFIEEKNKKYIIGSILFVGFFEAGYSIYQRVNAVIKNIPMRNATGFATNSNFLGTYLLLCLGYLLGLYFEKKGLKSNIFYFVSIILVFSGLLVSNALSCVVGLIGLLLFLIVYIIKNKEYKKYIILVISLVLVLVIFDRIRYTTILKDLVRTGNESVSIAQGDIRDEYGTKRIFVWRNTLKIVPKYFLYGVGVDNFYYAFDKPLVLPNSHMYFDKAHNEYLQTLVTQGIFSLINYLFLMGYIVIKDGKYRYNNKELYLLLPVVGYLIQAFFNISVIEVAPIFYISSGMLINRKE